MPFALLFATALWIHGGQYQPPPDVLAPLPAGAVLAQPGFGPLEPFDPQSWQWWFDFNQEGVLDLRSRMPARAAMRGQAYQPVTDDDRLRLVFPRLVEALRERPRDVRAAATMALARLGTPAALGAVSLVAESDRDLFVRTQAVLALGFSGRPEAVESLARIYTDEDLSDEVRSHAVVGLGLISDPVALGLLAKALDEKTLAKQGNQLRAAVIYAAGLAQGGALTDDLIRLSGTRLIRREPHLRALLAVSLGQGGRRDAVATVHTLLADSDSQVQRSAAMAFEGLAPTLDEDDAAKLIEAVDDSGDLSVRIALIRALGRSRTTTAQQHLTETLPDARYLHQTHQALALAFGADPASAGPLLALLGESREPSMRSAIAIALGLLGADDTSADVLALWQQENAPTPRGYLSLALGLLNPQQVDLAPELDTMIRESHDIEVIRQGTLALGLLGAREQLNALARDLPEEPGVIERAARVFALGRVGDRATLPHVLALAMDRSEQPYVRAYALQALADLCDPRPHPPSWRLSRHVALEHEVGFLQEMYRTL